MIANKQASHWWSAGIVLGSLLIPALLAGAPPADAPPPPSAETPGQVRPDVPPADKDYAEEPGVQVQTRGPVHEAFAQPTEVKPQPGPIVPKKPPDPITEEPPEQKPEGDNVLWIPGYWSWDDEQKDFLWVSGFWRVPPPGRRWVPGYWTEAEGGWQWVPGFWSAASQEDVQYLPAPPASVDNGPSTPAPDDNSFYVPGNWAYRATGYVWSPGYWSAVRPGWVWQPTCYSWTPSGFAFVNGYWDYPLESRGTLFAPVVFTRPLWQTAGWFFRPRFVVGVDALLNCFWARPSWCSFYFGDFYGPRFARLGFWPWCSWGPRFHGPLFSYYSWVNRGNPLWFRNMRDTFSGRFDGNLARPPRTLAEQRTLVQASAQSGNVINRNVNNIRIVSPFNATNVGRTRLVAVNRTELSQHQQTAQRLRELRSERSHFESRIVQTQRGELRGPREDHFRLPRETHVVRPAVRPEPSFEDGRTRSELPGGRPRPEVRGNPPARERTPAFRTEPRPGPRFHSQEPSHVHPPAWHEGRVNHQATARAHTPTAKRQTPVHRAPAAQHAPARHAAPQHHAPARQAPQHRVPPPPAHRSGGKQPHHK
jgi:hypothetical protein